MAFDEKFEVGSQQMQIPKLPSIFTLFYLFCIHLGKSEKATKALGRATSHHIHHLSLSLCFSFLLCFPFTTTLQFWVLDP